MFGLRVATKVYVALGTTDMHKGFEGLYGLVQQRLGLDALSGHLFLFANARRTQLKVLVWDGSGLWVCVERLEKGPFRWPSASADQQSVSLSQEELSLWLNGLDLDRLSPAALVS